MNEPKAFASLSSTLLARKGHAKPAMRPQGFAGFGMATAPSHDDLGWNDMGHEAEKAEQHSADIVPIVPQAAVEAPVTAEAPEVVRQQEELARELTPVVVASANANANASKVRAAPGSKGKAAFTLRLDPDRHLQLRLVCAVNHRSAQQVVIQALDAFLITQPAVADLTAAAKTKR